MSGTEDLDTDGLALGWSARWSLTSRILAVNIFLLALLAGSFFYLDSYRARLVDDRLDGAATQAALVVDALREAMPARRTALLGRISRTTGFRLRIYTYPQAQLAPSLDSWRVVSPTYTLRDPTAEPWQRRVARFMDRAIDQVVGADRPPPFAEPKIDVLAAWPEAQRAGATGRTVTMLRRAPDRTYVVSAAVRVYGDARAGAVLLVTNNARAITRTVRAERFWLGLILLGTLAASVLLSLFLARTIVRPLRRLALSAVRVRRGRAREVVVPRLPSRRDEIGMLARALSDMSQSLRQRIDAVEAFAADVSHELKNPLASLRSAVDALERVDNPALRNQLLGIVRDDAIRLDRLVTDVAEVSRLDAELSRSRFEPVDLGALIEPILTMREKRVLNGGVRVAFARPYAETAVVLGDASRLARLVENLLDNAVSFSPPGGLVEITAVRVNDKVRLQIDDEGPGIAVEQREAIFRRFHSVRPEGEEFGRHSGLGLAIARAIVVGHDGTIEAQDRGELAGARFLIVLPAVTVSA